MATKKKKKQKKLSSLIALLVLAIVALGTTTYAWFTSNRTVTISTLDVHVEAQNGLQISTDAATWKTVITNDDITTGYGSDTNQVPKSMEPVSTIGKLDTNGFMEMYYGTIKSADDGTQILTASKTTESKGDVGKFIAFDTFLKVEAESVIEMTTSSNVVPKNSLTDVGLQNAARVAFIIEGNADVTTETSEIRKLKTSDSSNVHIWEPNFDVHTSAAVTAARDTYGITTTTEGADRIAYSGVKTEISEDAEYDLCVALDSSDLERLGVGRVWFEKVKDTVVIDHHITNQNYGDANYVNAVASSTCQNIIVILAALDVAISKDMATCIYSGMLTDTGGFRYNIQPETFEFAGMLLETGIDIAKIYKNLLIFLIFLI